jgi:hypothetical protein
MEKLGDLRGAQVPGLGWLGQRALPFLLSSPVWGTLRLSGSDGIERSTHRCILCGLAPGPVHSWTLTSLPLPLLAPDLELR